MSRVGEKLGRWWSGAAAAAQAGGEPTVGIDELPLRAELMSVAQLEQHARTCR